MMKKVCSIVTALVLALTIFVVPNLGFAYAEEETDAVSETPAVTDEVPAVEEEASVTEESDVEGVVEEENTGDTVKSSANETSEFTTNSSYTWISASWSVEGEGVTYDCSATGQETRTGQAEGFFKFENLTPDTEYNVEVKAYNASSELIGTKTATVKTKSATVDTPAISIVNSSYTWILYKFTKNGDADGIAYKRGSALIGERTFRDNSVSDTTATQLYNSSSYNLKWYKLMKRAYYYLSIRAYKVVPADEIEVADGIRTIKGTDVRVYKLNGSGKDVIVSNAVGISKLAGAERVERTKYDKGYVYKYYDETGTFRGTSWAMWNTIKNKKSKTKYLIALDTRRNNIVIYKGKKGNWKPYKQFVCACGVEGHRTPRGDFKIQRKKPKFQTGDKVGAVVVNAKYTCWYATKFKGAVFFHSTLYMLNSKTKHAARHVGKHYSHGCVRLEIKNAKWIYQNCGKGTAVISRKYGKDCSYGFQHSYVY